MTILTKSTGEVYDALDKAVAELSGHHNAAALKAAIDVLDALMDCHLVSQLSVPQERAEELRVAMRQTLAIRNAFADPGIKRPSI